MYLHRRKGLYMKVYISGPMTGMFGLNKAAFRQKERELRAQGHEPINPIWARVTEVSWHAFMQADLAMLELAEAIVFLPGWENSTGAKIERRFAKRRGIKLIKEV